MTFVENFNKMKASMKVNPRRKYKIFETRKNLINLKKEPTVEINKKLFIHLSEVIWDSNVCYENNEIKVKWENILREGILNIVRGLINPWSRWYIDTYRIRSKELIDFFYSLEKEDIYNYEELINDLAKIHSFFNSEPFPKRKKEKLEKDGITLALIDGAIKKYIKEKE